MVLALILAVVAVPAHLLAVPGRTAHSLRVTGRHGVPVGNALRSTGFWFLVVAFVAQSGVTSAFLLMMVTWFRDVGFSPTVAAALPIGVGALQIVSRMGLAPLAARFGMAIVADTFGVARFGSILALMTVPIALSRAGTPLAAAWIGDWRFLVLLGAACLLAALALVPAARAPAP